MRSMRAGFLLSAAFVFAIVFCMSVGVYAEPDKSPGIEYSQNKIMIVTLKKKQQKSEIAAVSVKEVKTPPFRHFSGPAVSPYAKAPMILKTPQLFIADSEGKVLYTTDFFYHYKRTIPPLPERYQFDFTPPVIEITDPEVTLVLPYFSTAHLLIVHDEDAGLTPAARLIEQPYFFQDLQDYTHDGLVEGTVHKPAPAVSGKFNLLIMASRYNSSTMVNLRGYAQDVKSMLLSTSPFDQYTDKIAVNIYENTSSLGCYSNCAGIARLMCCDDSLVISAAASSGYPFDEIIVVDSAAEYAGSGGRDLGYYKTNSYSTYTVATGGSWTAPMVLHEFGHSFGNLCDEYSYGSEGYTYDDCVNCRPSCSEFSVTNICNLGCDAKPSYYRPDNSIMLSLSYTFYNQASIDAGYSTEGLKRRLEYFTGLPGNAQNNCAASVSSGLVVNVPIITFSNSNYWAALQFNSSDSTFTVSNAGVVSDLAPYSNCTASTLSSDFKLHIPVLTLNGASYWADLQYNGTVFVITGAGQN